MLSFFKKKNKEVAVAILQSTETAYPEVVEEIHHEFYTASDKAYETAMQIINEKGHLKEKADKLKTLGFTKVPEVKEAEGLTMNAEIVQSIQEYKTRYPFNKFITHEQVKAICEKYGLILGPVSRFIGFVPAVKLDEIASFTLKDKDKCEYEILSDRGEVVGYVTQEEIKASIVKYLNTTEETFVEFGDGDINVSGGNAKWGKWSKVRPAKQQLMICAPVKDFDTTGMEVKDRKLLNIPDPVVLQPVRNGYLILAAWGPEASDPIVVNEINN